jgi:sigma-B regulation protein RsbU (phosphoserine phosphatase)
VVEDADYQKYTHEGWTSGSIVVVGTDGIREAQNVEGEMFGLDRLRESIRKSSTEPAETIQNEIIKDLKTFQGEAPQEDDITLVVVKLL